MININNHTSITGNITRVKSLEPTKKGLPHILVQLAVDKLGTFNKETGKSATDFITFNIFGKSATTIKDKFPIGTNLTFIATFSTYNTNSLNPDGSKNYNNGYSFLVEQYHLNRFPKDHKSTSTEESFVPAIEVLEIDDFNIDYNQKF